MRILPLLLTLFLFGCSQEPKNTPGLSGDSRLFVFIPPEITFSEAGEPIGVRLEPLKRFADHSGVAYRLALTGDGGAGAGQPKQGDPPKFYGPDGSGGD